jgi:signal transduction histidine kinase
MVLRTLPEPGVKLRLEEVEEMQGKGRTTIVGIVVMTTVLVFIWAQFSPIVDPVLLGSWLAFMGLSVLYLCLLLAAFSVPRWRAARSARFWIQSTHIVPVTFCGGIAASVWILLPPADNDLRMFAIFLYVWFIAMVMMTGGDRRSVLGCLALIVSLVAFVLVHDLPYAVELAGFLIMAGVAIIGIRALIWRVADEATEARAMTQRAAESLERALAIVRAERDAKTRFIASASHDLQQPIQAAHLFMDQALESDDPVLRGRSARGARSAFQSVQALLETMLDHLRLDAGAVIARIADVAIDDMMGAVVLEHGPAADTMGIGLTLVKSRILVRADARLLQRALGNLVGNAIRHAQGTHILVGARLRDGSVELWVIDNGRGIAAGDAERLFEDFAQGSDHGLENRGGFGLGLSSARRLVDLQHGEVALDRRWRNGSAFVIRLPYGHRIASQPTPATLSETACKAA